MATFKVGQRVKVVGHNPPPHCVGFDYRGSEGFVTDGQGRESRRPELTVPVVLDGEPAQRWFRQDELVPLTDPRADEFIERIKKLEREPAPPLPVSVHEEGVAP